MLKIQRKNESQPAARQNPILLGKLLIVDDELMLLKLLERVFDGVYDVRLASSGDQALSILAEGFLPEVILADQRMPGMSGAEFLAKSRVLVPDAVRVILTGYTDVNDIIASINDGNVYKFLTKPWKNPELLQTVRHCFEHHNLSTQNKWLLEEVRLQNRNLQEVNEKLERQNVELRELNTRINNNMLQTVRMLSSLITAGELHYYTNHAQTVASIARALAIEMGMSDDTISTIVIAALLHDIGKLGLPEKIVVADPDTLAPLDHSVYESHVEKGWQILQSVSGLERVATIVLQHHECSNGRGFPLGLDEDQIVREAQIVAISDLYHNLVYRIPTDLFYKTAHPRALVQPLELTAHRQAEARKMLYKKARNFRLDVFEAFIQLIRSGACPHVQPGAMLENPPAPVDTSSGVNFGTGMQMRPTTSQQVVSVPITQIEVGMVTAQDVRTIDGTLVLPAGTVIDYHKFQKLREFHENRSIPLRVLFFKT